MNGPLVSNTSIKKCTNTIQLMRSCSIVMPNCSKAIFYLDLYDINDMLRNTTIKPTCSSSTIIYNVMLLKEMLLLLLCLSMMMMQKHQCVRKCNGFFLFSNSQRLKTSGFTNTFSNGLSKYNNIQFVSKTGKQYFLSRQQQENNEIDDNNDSNNNSNNGVESLVVIPDLLSLLQPIKSSVRVERMSVTDLAYIGDVVYELFIRCRTVWPSKRTSVLQDTVVSIVRAENQALLLQRIKNNTAITSTIPPTTTMTVSNNNNEMFNDDNDQNQSTSVSTVLQLTDNELQVLARGRNVQNVRHKNPVAYQESTSFEALIGYVYITNTTRCAEILQWINVYGGLP